MGVLGLAVSELVRGETVVPSERVPVVHVFFEDEGIGVGDGLFALETGEECVGGRATRAAFGGKEFDENRGTGGTLGCVSS